MARTGDAGIVRVVIYLDERTIEWLVDGGLLADHDTDKPAAIAKALDQQIRNLRDRLSP